MSCLLNRTMLPMPSSTDTTGLAYYWVCVIVHVTFASNVSAHLTVELHVLF